MVCTKDIDASVTLGVLPEVESKITCCIDRCTVASAKNVTVSESLLGEVEVHHLSIELGIRHLLDSSKNLCHRSIPEESGLADKSVMVDVHGGKGFLDTFCTDVNRIVEELNGLLVSCLDFFHHDIELRLNLRLFLCNLVCLDIVTDDKLVSLLACFALVVEVLDTPCNDSNLASHIV